MEPRFGADALVDLAFPGHQPDRSSTSLLRLLRLRDVLEIVPVSKSGWFAGINAGRFPKGRHLSPRVTVWRSDEIERLIDAVSHDAAVAASFDISEEASAQLPTRRYRDGKEV